MRCGYSSTKTYPGGQTGKVMPVVIGLDVGTQGARAIACDQSGRVLAQSSCPFDPRHQITHLPPGWFEQDAHVWWDAASTSLRAVAASLVRGGTDVGCVAAVAVDSTSGTILPVDESG
ncbi:MAG: FGGY family carbohydrate kinase, partial [Armatimonadota bacterium]